MVDVGPAGGFLENRRDVALDRREGGERLDFGLGRVGLVKRFEFKFRRGKLDIEVEPAPDLRPDQPKRSRRSG